MDVKTYLMVAGALGVAYVSYNFLNKPKFSYLPKDTTRRISQQIKHQMLIVCITYSKAMKKIRDDNKQRLQGKGDEVFNQFRGQLSQIYVAKQNLILRKFLVNKESYGKSLEKYKNDKVIGQNITEIFDMMERSIVGKLPDFTVPKQVLATFNKEKLGRIYREMVSLIGKKVTEKLQKESLKNSRFNASDDEDFRTAIRQLSIYDVKVDYLKSQGFKPEWGCPNQTKEEAFDKLIVAYEKTYEKIIQLVSITPADMSDAKIDNMFQTALQNFNAPQKVQSFGPPKFQQPVAPVQAPVQVPVRPKPAQQIDEDAELEALMMNELLNRSQEQPESQPERPIVQQTRPTFSEVKEEPSQPEHVSQQPQQILHPQKVGLTQEQVHQQGPQQGVNSAKQQATEQIEVAQNDQKLLARQEEVIKEILENQQ